MGEFRSFVHKETLHIIRDARTMLIVLLMPIIQVLLFGFAMSTEVNSIDVAVVAPHRSESIRQRVEQLSANPTIRFKGYLVATEIDHSLRTGQTDAVVVFAEDFDRQLASGPQANKGALVQLIVDASNTNTATAAAGYLRQIILPSGSIAGVETHLLYNPQMKSSYNFVPGIMGMIFILICAMMTSVSIVREKESGTMEVLLVSPVHPLWIFAAKMIPYFLLSCLNLASILLLARFVLDIPLSGSLGAIVGLSMLYLILALSFGLLISTFAQKQATALIISGMLLLLPTILLSGMAFPVENMPTFLQWVSCLIPTRWYIEAIRKLMIEGLPLSAVWQECTILTVMTVGLITAALHKFNDKLE